MSDASRSGGIHISCTALGGDDDSFTADPCFTRSTVLLLAACIEQQLGISVLLQRLTWGGQELDLGRRLDSYGITDGKGRRAGRMEGGRHRR